MLLSAVFSILHISTVLHETTLFQFDGGQIIPLNGEINSQRLRNFIEIHRLPSVIEFTADTANQIFERKLRRHVLYFISKEDKDFEARLSDYKQVSSKFRGKVGIIFWHSCNSLIVRHGFDNMFMFSLCSRAFCLTQKSASVGLIARCPPGLTGST